MFKIVCYIVQIKFVISFPFFPVDRGRICMCLCMSDNTRTLITHGRTRLNKTLFLRTFHDQNRRREVVDQCSLWKERPLKYISDTNVHWKPFCARKRTASTIVLCKIRKLYLVFKGQTSTNRN